MARTTIINALVFDGYSLHKDLTVTIENELITSIESSSSAKTTNSNIIDGKGSTLLPGFIDCHVHIDPNPEGGTALLAQLAEAGVTTALDMGFLPGAVRDNFRGSSPIADLRFAGNFATSTGSLHSRFPQVTEANLIDNVEQAVRFVEDRLAEGADYIKIIADVPGPSQEVVNTLAAETKKHGKLSIAHAARKGAWPMAQEAKVDIITHVPLDTPLDSAAALSLQKSGGVCVPTLAMAQRISSTDFMPNLNYAAAKESVIQLHKAGVPILAGTDANSSPMMAVKHGESLHRELELLVEAGLSNEEALRAATGLAAKWFRLDDRGAIEVGKRADLVIVGGNPIKDIAATRNVKKVWIAGTEVPLKG